jgi:hypothetical protein
VSFLERLLWKIMKTLFMTTILLATLGIARAETVVSPETLGGARPCGKSQEQSSQEETGGAIVRDGPQYNLPLCTEQRVREFLDKREAVPFGECPPVLGECMIIEPLRGDVPLCDDPRVVAMYYLLTDFGWDPKGPKQGHMTVQCRMTSTSPAEVRALCGDFAGKPRWCDVPEPELHLPGGPPPPPELHPPATGLPPLPGTKP